MKKPRKKTRSIASYRAASLKGARAKRRMKQASESWGSPYQEIWQFEKPQYRTIDLIPKVKWP